MAKFNVGDVVRHKDGIGVVRGIQKQQTKEDCFYLVDCFSFECGMGHRGASSFRDRFKEIIPDNTGWWFWGDELEREECVVEYKGFHVGDRVVTIKKDSYHEKGCTGTVVGFHCDGDCPIYVRFDKCYKIRGTSLCGILPIDSEQGVCEYTTDIKVIHPILGYIPEPEKPVEVKKYTDTVQACIEKIKKLLTF